MLRTKKKKKKLKKTQYHAELLAHYGRDILEGQFVNPDMPLKPELTFI